MDADSLALLAAKTGPASRIPYAWSMSDRVEPNVVVLGIEAKAKFAQTHKEVVEKELALAD